MNWKGFFRPTIGKISLTIILTILQTISFFYSGFGVMCKIGSSCFDKWYNYVAKILSFHTYFIVNIFEFIFDSPSINIILIVLVDLIVAYLVSCLIIFLYYKFKKMKKENIESVSELRK